MAKTKTATVGGTPTSPTASAYTSWMQGMLGNGAYTGAINNLLGGSVGDPKSLTQYFQQMGQQGGAQLNPINYNTPEFTATQFQNTPLSNQQMPNWMGTQFQQPPLFNGQFQNTQLQQAPLANQQWQNPQLNNNFQMSAGGIDPNSDYGKAIQQMVSNQQMQDVAALRERFTGTGGSSGTPAAYAESNYRAQAAPQLINAMEQANQAERGLNLQQMGLANNAMLGQNQILAGLGQAQNQFGLQQAGMNSDIINQMNQMQLQQGLAGNQFGLQGAGLNADIVNQMNQLNAQQGLAQNQFNQGNAQMGMQQTGMNADIINQLNQMMLSQNQNQNQFNLANSGQDLNAQMANSQNSLQNQQLMNQYGLGMGDLFQGLSGLNQQGILGALGMLGGQYSQLLGLGTPQAQTVQKPTTWGNILGTVGDLTGMAANLSGIPGLGSALSGLNPFGGRTAPTATAAPNPYMNTSFGQYPSYGGGLFGGYQGMPFGGMMSTPFNPYASGYPTLRYGG
jgi:hypothetical protein